MGFNNLFRKENVDQAVAKAVADKELEVFRSLVSSFGTVKKYTPDYPKLITKHFQLFFVTDEMQKGGVAYDVLQRGSHYLCEAFSVEPYVLLRKELSRASSVLTLQPNPRQYGLLGQKKPYPVLGQLFAIRPWQIEFIDNYKENGYLHTRRRIRVDIPHRFKMETIEGGLWDSPTYHNLDNEAWMYVSNYDEHFESWHMSGADRLFKSVPLIEAKHPYYHHRIE